MCDTVATSGLPSHKQIHRVKAKPYLKSVVEGKTSYRPVPVEQATHVMINMPGPTGTLILGCVLKGSRDEATDKRKEPVWSWNGSTDAPTLKPSIRTSYGRDGAHCCHTWVTDGKAQFLSDTTHDLAGKTVDLVDVDE